MAVTPARKSLLADTPRQPRRPALPRVAACVVTALPKPRADLRSRACGEKTTRRCGRRCHIDCVIDEMAATSPAWRLARIARPDHSDPHALRVVSRLSACTRVAAHLRHGHWALPFDLRFHCCPFLPFHSIPFSIPPPSICPSIPGHSTTSIPSIRALPSSPFHFHCPFLSFHSGPLLTAPPPPPPKVPSSHLPATGNTCNAPRQPAAGADPYPNCEVIIVDNDSRGPRHPALPGRARTPPDWHDQGPAWSPAPASSAGRPAPTQAPKRPAATTSCSSTAAPVVRDNWLDRLMGIAQRPESGHRRPRLQLPQVRQETRQRLLVPGHVRHVRQPQDNQLGPGTRLHGARPNYCPGTIRPPTPSSDATMLPRNATFDIPPLYPRHPWTSASGPGAGHKIVWTPTTPVHHGGVHAGPPAQAEGRLTDQVAVLR